MTGRDAAQAFENFLNGASKQDREEFAEYLTQNTHRTLQQNLHTYHSILNEDMVP